MEQGTSVLSSHIANVLAVMLIAGVFGGIVNYFLTRKSDPEDNTPTKCIVMGLGASLLVPLFLNMISSDLLSTSKGDPTKPGFSI